MTIFDEMRIHATKLQSLVDKAVAEHREMVGEIGDADHGPGGPKVSAATLDIVAARGPLEKSVVDLLRWHRNIRQSLLDKIANEERKVRDQGRMITELNTKLRNAKMLEKAP